MEPNEPKEESEVEEQEQSQRTKEKETTKRRFNNWLSRSLGYNIVSARSLAARRSAAAASRSSSDLSSSQELLAGGYTHLALVEAVRGCGHTEKRKLISDSLK
ncbi:hypothetical protein E2C01_033871 [Portunus trituberculatus]|uniref:Uncharacterized protein n=1 Tax=Portunus trituberculatus TaxID=210409 RepID=A0A5B7F3V7_PORTR|nr:hypothetical protein [Portunus trituberculatus]